MLVSSDRLLVQPGQNLAVKHVISPKGFQYDIFIVDTSNRLYYHENSRYYHVADNLPEHPNICITVDSDADRNNVDNDHLYDIYYINQDRTIVLLRYNIKTKKLTTSKKYTTTEPLQAIYPGNHGGCICTTFDGQLTRAYELYIYNGLSKTPLFTVQGQYRKLVDGGDYFYLITDDNRLYRIAHDDCHREWDDKQPANDLQLVMDSVMDAIYLQNYGKYRHITVFVTQDNQRWMASLHELNTAEDTGIAVKMINDIKLYSITDEYKFTTKAG